MKGFVFFVVGLVVALTLLVLYMTSTPGHSAVGALPPLTSEEEDLVKTLKKHVVTLSRDIGTRSAADSSRMGRALEYIQDALESKGYEISQQNVESNGKVAAILIAELKGVSLPGEIVLVGTHYDSPRRSPGADDNASGTAATLELARRMASGSYDRTLRFGFFALSESPFAGTAGQGARQYAARCVEKKEHVVSALLLEGLGSWSNAAGSQSAPFPLCFSYPSQGDFLAFVGDFGSRTLLSHVMMTFRATSKLPSEGCTLPDLMVGFGGSDAAAISSEGIPAVLATDTGSLRSELYGTDSDTHDRLDYERMARATAGLMPVVNALLRRGAPTP